MRVAEWNGIWNARSGMENGIWNARVDASRNANDIKITR